MIRNRILTLIGQRILKASKNWIRKPKQTKIWIIVMLIRNRILRQNGKWILRAKEKLDSETEK